MTIATGGPTTHGLFQRAEEEVARIADRLRRPPDGPVPPSTLRQGDPGVALFHAYAHLADPSLGFDALAHGALERAFTALSEGRRDLGLFDGVAGVGWIADHVSLILWPSDGGMEDLDEPIAAALDRGDPTDWSERWAWADGLAGVAAYWIQRGERSSLTEAALRRIVDLLEALAVPAPGGVSWPTERPSSDPVIVPGTAHGAAGVAWALASIADRGYEVERAGRLYRAARSWLLDRSGRMGDGSCFPYEFDAEGKPVTEGCRLAWCHGDAGIAAALLSAARFDDDEALTIARTAAKRSLESAGVVDPALCHGAAGLGHLFGAMARGTGCGELAEAGRLWLDHALTLRHLRPSTGGYADLGFAPRGFLDGDAGVGLALLATCGPIPSTWDQLLCASPATPTA